MPAHPSEETAPGNLTDIVAQHSKDSNASDHPLHDENKGATRMSIHSTEEGLQGGKGGPQIPEGDLPEAKSKEQLQAEAKKLNE